MENLFNLLKEKYMKYKTEYRDFKDCKVLKIFGSQADQDITVLADETGVILQFMNFHTHFDRDLNDDFEFISESIDEIINDCYFEYEITYNNELIVRGGISTEDFDFRNDSSFFDGFKRYLLLML
jgi:hypothetical protein